MNWLDAYKAEYAQAEIWRQQAWEAFEAGDREAFDRAERRWEASLDKCELMLREPEMEMTE